MRMISGKKRDEDKIKMCIDDNVRTCLKCVGDVMTCLRE